MKDFFSIGDPVVGRRREDYFIGELSPETLDAINRADIVFVPQPFRDTPKPLFPVGNSELFQYVRSNLVEPSLVEIAVEDKDYLELALHADLLRLGQILVEDLALPTLAGLLVIWIAKWRANRPVKADVTASLVVHKKLGNQDVFWEMKFEGPAESFDAACQCLISKTSSNESIDGQLTSNRTPHIDGRVDNEH